MYNISGRDYSQSNVIVATNLPKGKTLFSQAGQSASKKGLLAFARRCGNCPPDIEVVSAESVGIEWHSRRGKEPWGDEYRKGKWVILHATDHPRRDGAGIQTGAQSASDASDCSGMAD